MEGCRDQIPHNTFLRWTRRALPHAQEGQMQKLARRDVLRGTGVAALAAGAAAILDCYGLRGWRACLDPRPLLAASGRV